ncbi:hypothetical protein [Hyphomonas sp.]|uniref:hypothetical protein n=1 Tax=Hyphomonas sp. TaxID=87 RepID=UPI0025B9830A|nr:hypothetical protein [Hyphomonas sp.]
MASNEIWIEENGGFSRTIGGKLLAHCFIAMFLGFVGGFVWLIALADNVFHILPLPRMEIQVPDQKELMRNAHTGTIANSMYVMAMVALSPWLRFSVRQAKWVYYWAIIMLWGNVIGYSTAVFTPYRGIQPVFENDIANLVSYFTFYAAVIGAVVTTGICLNNALREARTGKVTHAPPRNAQP